MDRQRSKNKDLNLWRAKLAQEANRYEDMARYMKTVAESDEAMTKDEDNLLAVAYKRLLEHKRNARRTLMAIEQKDGPTELDKTIVQEYRSLVEQELRVLCDEVLSVIETALMPKASDPAARVFYWKLRGDYHRYVAEVNVAEDRSHAVNESREAYERAGEMSRESLRPTHPLRLGLMLNYSVFLYQICQQRRQGHQVAKQAFDDAIAEIDVLEEDSYDDSTLIMRLIRDNLSIWNQESGGSLDEPPILPAESDNNIEDLINNTLTP
ncbi:14-3-3 protein zeta-like [Adelges cooleyi]|uniref:14-3-3 protein zeta-like n=1 Tax=Adelges cooleyi TaxID=133065 RepID=UPI00217F945F|nr:14-3-3 protein zeta-like [Adelges cooleyi]